MQETRTGAFVHVVASLDLDAGSGRFLYVNPSTVTTAPESAPAEAGGAMGPEPSFTLRVEDHAGHTLALFAPRIYESSDPHDGPRTALVNEDIPIAAGMRQLVLLHGEREIDRFVAGAGDKAAAGIALGAAPPGGKPQLEVPGHAQAELGVSYTVQVRPMGEETWQTIAVGRPTPEVALDRNQFPDRERVQVRVLRSTGFADELVGEQDVDLREQP